LTLRLPQVQVASAKSACQIHEIWRLPIARSVLVRRGYESEALAFQRVILRVLNPFGALP